LTNTEIWNRFQFYGTGFRLKGNINTP